LHNKNHSGDERAGKTAGDKAVLDKQGEEGKRVHGEAARSMGSI